MGQTPPSRAFLFSVAPLNAASLLINGRGEGSFHAIRQQIQSGLPAERRKAAADAATANSRLSLSRPNVKDQGNGKRRKFAALIRVAHSLIVS